MIKFLSKRNASGREALCSLTSGTVINSSRARTSMSAQAAALTGAGAFASISISAPKYVFIGRYRTPVIACCPRTRGSGTKKCSPLELRQSESSSSQTKSSAKNSASPFGCDVFGGNSTMITECCPANRFNFGDKDWAIQNGKRRDQGVKVIIWSSRPTLILSAMSSAFVPCHLSSATPRTTIPAATSVSFRFEGRNLANQASRECGRALESQGDHFWSGSRQASNKNSTTRNTMSMSAPLSRQNRADCNAVSNAGFINTEWRSEDYRK